MLDLIVIGAGSGGVRAARMAASQGKSVAIIESGPLGGTCVNVGCVPKKLFVYSSHVAEAIEDAKGFGWETERLKFNWKTLLDNKNTEILRLNGIYLNILENAGVNVHYGHASFIDSNRVKVNEEILEAERILVATGSKPFVPSIPGNEHIVTSNEMFYLDDLPQSALIVGGGYIAVEFAGILNGFGVDVELLYRGEKFLRGFDGDLRDGLFREMPKKGIKVSFNSDIQSVVKNNQVLEVTLKDGRTIESDLVMYATGRVPNTDDLGLENTKVKLNEKGAIVANERFQSNDPAIFAIGDVIDRIQLTPVAIEEAMVLVDQLYGDDTKEMDYTFIPSAVFSQPNLASVGFTEEEAKEKFKHIKVYISEFKAMKIALSNNDEKVLMKLIVNEDDNKVIGAHMLGPDAGELIQGIAIAIKAGATKADFDNTVGIHPSSAEEMVTMRVATR